ncbi:ETS-related transcription factor Elf-2-like isoform X2 [Dendronephthya gigantea]|nr:ETS-related transcription factor Elf-2-like isoform X2 [Dendronephthya gigantea]XP_028412937.1 ETS-related transcription factor Elf-2-like isoform X2 [Dendronephthya gigantea]
MKPMADFSSPDDRPLNTYLSPNESSIGYGNVQECGVLDDSLDLDIASLIDLTDEELEKNFKFIPNLSSDEGRWLGFDIEHISTTSNRIATCPEAFVDDLDFLTGQEGEEPPPTPTPEEKHVVDQRLTVPPKKPGIVQRKQPIKRPRRPRPRNRGNRSIHLWEFLKEMLNNSDENKSYIRWISKREGIFQLVNSSGVAKLWGQRKNRKNMTYEKMSRALRYYYEKDILERVPNARLIYKFGGKTRPIATENGDDSLSDSSEN